MIPNESNSEELPDKEFKGRIADRFRQLRESRNVPQEHKNERTNGIKTSIQNMRVEFSKQGELLKQSRRKRWWDCNASLLSANTAQWTASPSGLTDHVENRASGLEGDVKELDH